MTLTSYNSNRTWDPIKGKSGSCHEQATIPERIFPHIISSVGNRDDASMSDDEIEVS